MRRSDLAARGFGRVISATRAGEVPAEANSLATGPSDEGAAAARRNLLARVTTAPQAVYDLNIREGARYYIASPERASRAALGLALARTALPASSSAVTWRNTVSSGSIWGSRRAREAPIPARATPGRPRVAG